MGHFNTVLMDAVINGLDNYKSMAAQVTASDKRKTGVRQDALIGLGLSGLALTRRRRTH